MPLKLLFILSVTLLHVSLGHDDSASSTKLRDKLLSRILNDLDQRMDELMKRIFVVDKFGDECTFNIPTYMGSIPSDEGPMKLQLEEWLENLVTLRDGLAGNYFSDNKEQIIVHLLRVATENGVKYASQQLEKNSQLKVCNRTKFLTCNVTKPVHHNDTATDTTTSPKASSSKGICLCYSRNDTNCEADINLSAKTKFEDEEHAEKMKCHAREHSIHTRYVKELDLCMLAEQAFCPIGPSYLMCEPGLSCITVDSHRLCDLENVAPLYGNLLGKTVTSVGYSKEEEAHGSHKRRRRRRRDASVPNSTNDNYLVMRRISSNDLFCRCHNLYNCRDSKNECNLPDSAVKLAGKSRSFFWPTVSLVLIRYFTAF